MEILSSPAPVRGETVFQARIASDPQSTHLLSERLVAELVAAGLVSDTERGKYVACFGEAIKNAVEHGNRSEKVRGVWVRAWYDGGEWGVVVEDEGEGFDPKAIAAPSLPADPRVERGRGIFLMRHVMERVAWYDGGRTLWLSRSLGALEFSALDGSRREEICQLGVQVVAGVVLASARMTRVEDGEIERLFDALEDLAREARERVLVLDLSGVEYLNSRGLGRLVALGRACQGREQHLRLCRARPALAELLRTMALDALFPLFAQPDEAIEGSLGELSGRPASPGSARD